MPETVNHQDHQKNTEEKTPSSMLDCESEGTLETVTSNVARESDTCSDEDKETVPCESASVSSEVSDPDKEQETQVKHVIPNTEKNLEAPYDALDFEAPLSTPLATSSLTSTFVDNGAEETEAMSIPEQLEANSSDLTAEMLDPTVILATPTSISPTKGILKRSIRGCRGICSCLNCSSFRLNAERAFEFSRNQLQDTEVMVLDLVGEISHLRDMLEKHDSESYKSQVCAEQTS